MPNTQKSALKKANKIVEADTAMATSSSEETAYECLLRKVNENKQKLQEEVSDLNSKVKRSNKGKGKGMTKVAKTAKIAEVNAKGVEQIQSTGKALNKANAASVNFMEDDSIVDIEVEGVNTEFPTLSEEELETGMMEASVNNNATVSNVNPMNSERTVQGHFHDNVNKGSTATLLDTQKINLSSLLRYCKAFLSKRGL